MTREPSPELRERIENTIRFLAVDAVEKAGSGHPGAPMGLARPAFELWDQHLRFDPADPKWPLRDRFVLSNGHASMLLYALLHLFGYPLSLDEIVRFRQLGSKTPGHPEFGHTPGVEVTTGPLGQGFANGVGMALAARLARARYGVGGEGPGHHFVYGIVSDGDLMEGISSEAGSLAGHLGLGNLIYLWDDNRVTHRRPHLPLLRGGRGRPLPGAALAGAGGRRRGPSRAAPRAGRRARGAGAAFARDRAHRDRPRQPEPGRQEQGARRGARRRGGPADQAGGRLAARARVPDSRGRARLFRRADPRKARRRAAKPTPGSPAGARRARRRQRPGTPRARAACRADLVSTLSAGLEGKDDATRKHGAVVLERLAAVAPYYVGGSGDLAGSAAPPLLKGRGIIGPGAAAGEDPFAGSNLHFGVREHSMGAISNGIALDGTFRPYCGTFLIFSDYMRPAIRLAALMRIPSIFVFTHDSIFLGEDGPTHQPIEHLDALRAIPNLTVWRPADGVETAIAWAWIARHTSGPSLLALSRQTVPALVREAPFQPEDVLRGAYCVQDAGAAPRVVLVATGSEVSLACAAAEKLRAEGTAARVVSMPCVSLFLEQPEDYQRRLIPESDTLVVAIEAARGESLRRFVGRSGLVCGIDRFGASAPYPALAEAFGFTPDAIAARVRARLAEGSAR